MCVNFAFHKGRNNFFHFQNELFDLEIAKGIQVGSVQWILVVTNTMVQILIKNLRLFALINSP